MTDKQMNKTIKIPQVPRLEISVLSDPVTTRYGWFANCYAVAKYRSKNGVYYQIFAPLNADAAKKLTAHLLFSGRVPADFVDTPSEQKRISKLIANHLAGITARHATAYKARGYPLRFKTY
jgi:hypothetical protein